MDGRCVWFEAAGLGSFWASPAANDERSGNPACCNSCDTAACSCCIVEDAWSFHLTRKIQVSASWLRVSWSVSVYAHPIVVNEFLRKVVHHTFNSTANTFGTICFARAKLAANLVSFALCAWGKLAMRTWVWGNTKLTCAGFGNLWCLLL